MGTPGSVTGGDRKGKKGGGFQVLKPMESNMLTANKADGLVLVVNYPRCG